MLYTDLLKTYSETTSNPMQIALLCWIGCVTRKVSSRSVYIRSKDETFSDLKPKLDRGDGVGGVGDGGSNSKNIGFSGRFLLPGDYGEEQALKGRSEFMKGFDEGVKSVSNNKFPSVHRMSVFRDGEFLRDYLTITEIDQILVYLTAMFGVYELMSKKSNHIR
ncbi:unnamed protein product [Brassica rapa]|uniref:Uncharacterized protein n=1 Tax=Brassica campestris TaxID=3711 RepID=A0A3P6CGR4_BRACM|nr:unnamed protein product [Brassica rapa]VDD12194.1 unnamed protein product [Brassica rapa]